MLFHTPRFFLFLAVILFAFYTAPRSWRRVILLAASYYFYMCWIPKFILLLLFLTVIDYVAARWIASTEAPGSRKIALIVSLSANLGLLGFFKYYNFFASNIALLLSRPADSFAMSIILPMGISFHTFQSISYVVDVYRREQEPVKNPIDYALFISFFPQLVAGPIVRAREFFADLYHWRAPVPNEVFYGALMVLFGLVKKMIVADHLAQVSDAYFKNVAAQPGMLTAWSGVIAFGVQIFFDFSGYTDMAIGMALLLGFHFPMNFRRPYLATSITEFWRRWHMSLSRWLRDYLYISLGREPARAADDVPQPDADHAARRAVAWRELEFRGVGRLSRSAAQRRARARSEARGRTDPVEFVVSLPVAADAGAGHDRVGVLPRGHFPR